eukprot:g2989.t1
MTTVILETYNPQCVLVTGGAGFIGSHVVEHLCQQGIPVVCVDRLDQRKDAPVIASTASSRSLYTFAKADICDYDFMIELLDKRFPQIDTIIHFAAQSHVDKSFHSPRDAIKFSQDNVLGTHTLLECVNQINSSAYHPKENEIIKSKEMRIKRFIHVSTDEVLGDEDHNDEPNVVDSQTCHRHTDDNQKSYYDPSNPYAATKAAAELLCHAYRKSYKLPVIITRSSNVYGPAQIPDRLIPRSIWKLLQRKKKHCSAMKPPKKTKNATTLLQTQDQQENEEKKQLTQLRQQQPCITLHGNGLNKRQYLYISDLVQAFVTILQKGTPGRTYNICGTVAKRNIDVARDLIRRILFNHELTQESNDSMAKQQGNKKMVHRKGTTTTTTLPLTNETDYIQFVEDRPYNDLQYFLDSTEIKKLGWRPTVTWEEGLRRTIAYYEKLDEKSTIWKTRALQEALLQG